MFCVIILKAFKLEFVIAALCLGLMIMMGIHMIMLTYTKFFLHANYKLTFQISYNYMLWLSARVLGSRLRVCKLEPQQRYSFVSLSKTLDPFNPGGPVPT